MAENFWVDETRFWGCLDEAAILPVADFNFHSVRRVEEYQALTLLKGSAMNIRILLQVAIVVGLPYFVPGNAGAQSGTSDEARQKALDAKVAAEKAFDLIDRNIKALQTRRPVPGVVPPELLKSREDAWNEFLKAAAASSKYEDAKLKAAEAYKDVNLVYRAIQGSRKDFDKWLQSQKIEINDARLRANIMNIVKEEKKYTETKPHEILRILSEYGPAADSYRDDLLSYLKSGVHARLGHAKDEEYRKFNNAVMLRNKSITLVHALVRIDPSLRSELAEYTKDWYLQLEKNARLFYRGWLDKALDGK